MSLQSIRRPGGSLGHPLDEIVEAPPITPVRSRDQTTRQQEWLRSRSSRQPQAGPIALHGSFALEPIRRARVEPHKPIYEVCKRFLDLAFCLAALPMVLPVLGLAAAAVRLSDGGPVLFWQERTGRSGRRFRMWKLRTMVVNAEELKGNLTDLNERDGPDFKIEHDPRITTLGRWLRRTSLDELPQIFNVLGGTMSLVGPRPTSFAAETYTLWHTERLEVPPGITGLWQIQGRGGLDFDERVRLDIEYVRRRSIALDLTILLRTIVPVLSGRGAS
ncbi:MAG: sugar transferase [Deltaproteobacteria bacterium]|nr:sugar transferase [Deltaproteobacteria bacterium]